MHAVAAVPARSTAMIMPGRGPPGFRFRIPGAFGVHSAAPAGRFEMVARADTAEADMPRWIGASLAWPGLVPISRVALVSAFLIGGIQKFVDFPGAVAEQAHFGLQPAWLWAAAAVVVEIGGSLLVIFGRWVWLGAGGLGVLTVIAMLAANNFWALT